MSALRKCLMHPGTYLALLGLLGILTALDMRRPPQQQFTARIYLSVLGLYQQYGRPALEGTIRCRYIPTCSEYSRQAVGRHGLAGGLKLTFIRIHSCTKEVQPATPDPPPM
jgi:putative component of membrane protein insertase Oxa1/YidC/SpoIIIJ protein YidD